MKEKKTPGPCHSQHVQVLNCLTDTLKDELKRGLTLLDNCVNQLAQAKWILINVERTMEDFYQDCPACEGVPPKGNRASTPPSNNQTIGSSSTAHTSKKTSASSSSTTSKAKKASVLPMVSGHTINTKSKIKISRVDARGGNKKTKRSEVRSRSTSSGGNAAESSREAVPSSSSVNNLDETVVVTSSRKKTKPGPRSKTRILANGGIPSNYNLDGDNISVDLEDIGDVLGGRESISGAELLKLMNIKGHLDQSASTSSQLVESENKKRNKIDSTSKTKDESETSGTLRKKVNEKAAELKPLAALSSSTATTSSTLGGKPDVKSLIQQTFLQFAKNKDFGKLGLKAKLGAALLASSKPAVSSTTTASTEERDDKKTISSSSDVATTSSSKVGTSNEKKSDGEENSDTEPVKRGTKRKETSAIKSESKVSDSKKVLDDSDDSDSEILANKIKKKKPLAGKKSASENEDDDSDVSSSVRKRKRGRKSPRKKTNISDDSDSEFVAPGGNSKKVGGGKKPKRKNSSDEDSDYMDVKSKTSERRSSRDSKASSSVRSTRDNKSSEPQSSSSTTNNNDNSSNKTSEKKPVPKAKRTGGKPLSVRLREEKENELKKQKELENMKKEGEKASDGTENATTTQNKSTKNSTAVVFSDDSDSDNSMLRTTIRNIPLDLQDAARSPSPETPKDNNIFGKLLSAYNPLASSESSVTGVQKLKSRAKEIQSKVFELDDSIQKKLGSVGRELIPYSGKMDISKCPFSTGTYYIIGKINEEKLVFMDTSSELQELDLGEDDIQELLDD